MKAFAAYRGLGKSVSGYWRDYGGWSGFFGSPLLHLSVLITAASYEEWMSAKWSDLPLSLLPNLLGFSLGAYALIFSLANENLLSALNAPSADGGSTLLRMINASFLHFILIQTLAIIFALSQKSSALVDLINILVHPSRERDIFTDFMAFSSGAFGYWLTVYAVVLLIGAALAAYRLAIMSGKAASVKREAVPTQAPEPPTS